MHISACTADVTEQNEIRCTKIGFDSVLFKPISFNKLKNLIETILS